MNNIAPEKQIKIFLICFSGAFYQEFIFTYIIFSFLNKYFSLLKAVFLTSTLFAVLHLGNGNSNYISVISHFIGSNIYIIAFIASKNIFSSIGLHLGWNYAQIICSLPMSGTLREGIFSIHLPKADLWLGTNYGIESGIVSIFLRLIIILIFLFYLKSIKKNNMKKTYFPV